MLDLNDLRVFERAAALNGFSAAARALRLPKSSVSRSIARLEAELGLRLFQRTTRDMTLTAAGAALRERLGGTMDRLAEAVAAMGAFGEAPRGRIRVSCGIGFGIAIVAERLPEFLARHPEVEVSLALESRTVDLVADGIDVAIRLAPLRESSMVATRLGVMNRYLCAAPAYLETRGAVAIPGDLAGHDAIEMPGAEGRSLPWQFSRGGETVRFDRPARLCVNEALAIHRLVLGGAGIGVLSGYLCGPDVLSGRLVRLLPDWTLPGVPVSLVFPSRRELAPAVRAFAAFMKAISAPGASWRNDPLAVDP